MAPGHGLSATKLVLFKEPCFDAAVLDEVHTQRGTVRRKTQSIRSWIPSNNYEGHHMTSTSIFEASFSERLASTERSHTIESLLSFATIA
jgi:hypothetical protein